MRGQIAVAPSSTSCYLYLASTRPINTSLRSSALATTLVVRLYADAKAVESANAIDALAYMDAVMVEDKGGGKARRKECLPFSLQTQWTFGDCAAGCSRAWCGTCQWF